MRTAVCFSGLLRPATFECIENIIESIVRPNNADVFIHTWNTNEPHSILSDEVTQREVYTYVLEKLSPKLFEIQEKIYFDPHKYPHSHDIPKLGLWAVSSLQSMFYSIMKANDLKKRYEKENNFKYDCVFRCRLDIKLTETYEAKKYDLNSIMTSTNSDILAFSNSNNMDHYSDLYNRLDSFSDKYSWQPEAKLMRHLSGHNIVPLDITATKNIVRTISDEQVVDAILKMANEK